MLRGTLSRKHFNRIAKVLCRTNASRATVEAFADYAATENPRFKRDLFLARAYCPRDRLLNGAGRRRVRR